MKNFDIEKLERKNFYKTPTNFFEKVQENVLNETVFKENKVVELQPQRKQNLNWIYAAATLVFIFGGLFIFNQYSEVNAENTENNLIASGESNAVNNSQSENKDETESVKNYYTFTDDLNKIEEKNTRSTAETPIEIKKPTIKKTKTIARKIETNVQPQEQVDLLLETFSEEEIATLAQNTENDIYLDLYN